jgi:16S rRNA (cytosine967-C5)-methyltransferase
LKTPAPKSAVSPARAAAFDILMCVEREDAFASELLHAVRFEKLSPADHGLLTELVMGVLRWRSRLDAVIAGASSQPVAKLDAEVLNALRVGIYQLGWLERVPARAAIHESVELVKAARKRSAAGFVNAVLRKLAADSNWRQPKQPDSTTPTSLAERFAHPAWLVERWITAFGLETAEKICEYDQRPPVTTIRLRDPHAEDELRAAGVELAPGSLLSNARRVVSGDITKTNTFREKRVVIQDEASQLVAALLGSGERLLDCCAAPGSKTSAFADRNPDATVVAADIHPHRARLLRRLVRGEHVHVVAADARELPVGLNFDRVLTDVPCSGTGTLARNPEIKWRLRSADLADLHARQAGILSSALTHVASGGRLIYSTCSLEPEENEQVVSEVMRERADFRLLDCSLELQKLSDSGELAWADIASLTAGRFLRTIPGVHPCDGFFAVVVERS